MPIARCKSQADAMRVIDDVEEKGGEVTGMSVMNGHSLVTYNEVSTNKVLENILKTLVEIQKSLNKPTAPKEKGKPQPSGAK